MKNCITLLLSGFLFLTAFASGPTFVVEESDDEYTMYLRIDDIANIETIVVQGDFSQNGVNDEVVVSISSDQLSDAGINMAAIQTIGDDFDYANYTVYVLDSDGNISEYPVVQVAMNDLYTSN